MKQNKIISIINRISKQNSPKERFMLSEPFVCLANSYYFVKPGDDAKKFFQSVKYIIAESYRSAESQFEKQNSDNSFALALQSTAARLSTSLIRESFNKEYFDSQIDRIDIEDLCDSELLEKYLKLLDIKQIKEFLMLNRNGDGFLSISQKNLQTMYQRLNKECCRFEHSIPNIDDDFDAYQDFEKENQYYYFDYLSKESIVNILLEYVDTQLDKAVFTAKALFHSNVDFAYNCLTLLFYFQEYWGANIIDPLSLEEVKINNVTKY